MALNPTQKSSRLFKKSLGAAETLVARDFFNEPKLGKSAILTTQIWAESSSIPTTAPTLSDGQTLGVVKYYEKLTLDHIGGSDDLSYSHDSLKNSIPFNFGDGTYNYSLYKNDGTTVIAFGVGDWLIDNEAGVLTFYGTLPAGVTSAAPPKVSFYQYVGEFGLPSGATSGIHTHTAVRVASTGLTDATYSTTTSGYTTLPSDIDGVTSFVEGDRILIKNQTTQYQNGLFVVNGTTLVRAADHDGNPGSEISVGDYVFVYSGTTNKNSGWALSNTDGDPSAIIPGVNTQVWEQFSASQSYTADGNALQLAGNEFKVVLDANSGLEQSINGLRVTTSVMTNISNAVSSGTSLSTALESEISIRTSITDSLSTALGNIDFSSLESVISTETSNRIVANSSLEGALTGETSTRLSVDTILSNSISTEASTRLVADNSLSSALTGETSIRTSQVESLSTALGNIDFSSIESALTGETSLRMSADASLETAISTESSIRTAETSTLSSAISTETSDRLVADSSLEGALTGETSLRMSADASLATAIDNIDFSSLEGLISTETSNRISADEILSTAISTESSVRTAETSTLSTAISTETSARTSADETLSTAISTEVSTRESADIVLSTEISTEVSTRTAEVSTLSTALSTEVSIRESADISLATALDNFSGVTAQTAGSGLTYVAADQTLNVKVDDLTIKIVNDELRGSQIWIQSDKSTTIASGTGETSITLTYDPVTPVMVQVNGIEYLLNIGGTTSATDKPFFFTTALPTVGSKLCFDATEAGFGLESGVDLIIVKYNFVSLS